MGNQIDAKAAILIIIVVVLIGAGGYLVYLIQDGSSPLVLLDSQASDDDLFLDDPLLDDESLRAQGDTSVTPSPTIAYTSTSPTPTPSEELEEELLSPTVTPEPTELPQTGGEVVVTPTPVTQLPTAGITDYLPAVFGGALLILIAMIL